MRHITTGQKAIGAFILIVATLLSLFGVAACGQVYTPEKESMMPNSTHGELPSTNNSKLDETDGENTITQSDENTSAGGSDDDEPAPRPEVVITKDYTVLEKGSKGTEVRTMQQRLVDLGFLSEAADGTFGNNTEKAVKVFQRDSGLEVTGVADNRTLNLLYSDFAPIAKETFDHEDVLDPNHGTDYYIIVYTDSCNVLVLGKDDYGKYNQVIKNFECSVGKGNDNVTPAGLYAVQVRYDWRAMFGGVYAQYAVRFYGNYLFHSVPYYTESPDDLEMEEFEKLGTPASLGCVRLCVRDAKWIYDNAVNGTQVRILSGKTGPSDTEEIPELIYEPEYRGWDPTDPDPNNPYNASI